MFNSASALQNAIDRTLTFTGTVEKEIFKIGSVTVNDYYYIEVFIDKDASNPDSIRFECISGVLYNIESKGKIIGVGIDDNNIFIKRDYNGTATVTVIVEYIRGMFIADIKDDTTSRSNDFFKYNSIVLKNSGSDQIEISKISIKTLQIGGWSFTANDGKSIDITYGSST